MKILAISGSGREASTNTALLRAVSRIAQPLHEITVFSQIAELPVFSPDREDAPLPRSVQVLADMIRESDGLIFASPEYVRTLPGGLKNALDWLVSREELIGMPIALLHASHRGDDMLGHLRLVLSTVSERFTIEPFLRVELGKLSVAEISQEMMSPPQRMEIECFLRAFVQHIEAKPKGF